MMIDGGGVLLSLLIAALWMLVLYQLIRRAVCAGILDADRKRGQAAVERELMERLRQQSTDDG